MASSSSVAVNTILQTSEEADPAFGALPAYQKTKWVQMMLSTMFRRLSYKQLVARATSLLGVFDYKAMWRACMSKGYLVKNVKCWIYYCVAKKLRGQAADAMAPNFFVKPEDYGLRLLITSDLRCNLQDLAEKGHPALTIRQFDGLLVSIHKEIREWLGKFVYRKMRFVYQQQGLQDYDLQMEIFAKGINALYLTYPRLSSDLHALNVVKSAAHNYGINIIKSATTNRRSRLLVEKDRTFRSRVISIHDVPEGALEQLVAEPDRWASDRWLDVSSMFSAAGSSKLTLRRLLYTNDPQRVYKRAIRILTPQQRLLAIFCGYEDQGFTQWLIDKRRLRSSSANRSCADYYERAEPKQFLELACKFLDLPLCLGLQFMNEWRTRLGAYK